MTGRIKWLYGLGIVVFLASFYFNWTTHKTNQNYKANAQGDLLLGTALIGQADGLNKSGNTKLATALAYEGIGYIRASVRSMEQVGVNNVSGVASFMNQAISNILDLGKRPTDVATKTHDQQVIDVLESSFQPFGRINYGSVNNGQLKQALDHVYQAMTPQERQQFEGEG